MSDTPETDEQINGKPCTSFFVCAGDTLRDALVPSEFARKLERERNDARGALKRITECDMRWSKKIARDALEVTK